ncbi:hypothetical protein MNB_SM-3-11 [hydrothermal vent metagenome]|uniref:Lipoprotein n=1 Tax=hydrothermal vent metagenome TaxID=652676 RepID=A0A1W1D3T8_9ZZZZ
MKRGIIVFAVAFFIAGCHQQQIKTESKKVKKENSQQQIQYPKWIDNPNMDGERGAVGIVKLMKNKKKQEYLAKKLAIASYQEQKRVIVDSTINTSETVKNNNDVTTTSSMLTRQTASHFKTEKMVKKADFSDKENYYIWMVVKK